MKAAPFITAILAIMVITTVAMFCGYNNHIVTASVSAIVGITAGFAAYYKGKSKASSENKGNGDKKADSSS